MIITCSLNKGIVCINNNNLLLILIHQVHTLTCSYYWVFQYYYFVWYGLIATTTVADSDLKVSGESALPVPKIKGATLKIYFSGPQFGLEIRWRPSPPPLGPLPWDLSPRSATLPYQTVTFLVQRIQSTWPLLFFFSFFSSKYTVFPQIKYG